MTHDDLMARIEETIQPNTWCTAEKGKFLGSWIVERRPKLIVEVGVWEGGSLIPMLLALRETGQGRAIAIDAWDPEASKAGEIPANAKWWGTVDHEQALITFRSRLVKHELTNCEIWRKKSDDCTPPPGIDLFHLDGNHTEQAFRDARRFLPALSPDGIAVLDDVDWTGSNVQRAVDFARALGFVKLRDLDKGVVLQRQAKPL
jgi:predicted O-methyltransferase YrrM